MEFFADSIQSNGPCKTDQCRLETSIDGLPDNSPNTIVPNILSAAYAFAGLIAVVIIIASGIKLTISSGSPEKIAAAKRSMIFAVVGLLIVILASAITYFVTKGVNV